MTRTSFGEADREKRQEREKPTVEQCFDQQFAWTFFVILSRFRLVKAAERDHHTEDRGNGIFPSFQLQILLFFPSLQAGLGGSGGTAPHSKMSRSIFHGFFHGFEQIADGIGRSIKRDRSDCGEQSMSEREIKNRTQRAREEPV
jgi:hypothetical protein